MYTYSPLLGSQALPSSGIAAHSRREAKAQASLSRASGSAGAYFAAHANSYFEVIKA